MMNTARFIPSRRKRQTWVCVVAGLFLCDFVVCGYIPAQQRLMSLREARSRQRGTIAMAAAQNTELAGLRTRLRNAERIVECFDALVPPDQEIGTFLQQITAVMTECHLADQAILPGKETQAGDLGCFPVRMTCKGTLTDLFNFFNRLQALNRLVRIEKVTMENDADFTGRLTLQTEAVIFYQSKQFKAAGAADAESVSGVNHGA